mmetsp:Transcript_11558/g.13082  ORF Transcript_11558/g.13082 Transcript_11558/m.13082 type:complete len:139 (-) Transcript_11558:74-490(-)|eukprot:CAMPEP_0205826216 /NCGR_PEP_ID=MMETSP0206-20130828/27976_1 /ASSEMBLY_ACC=CAM_ASM_000279 /TAXON_ID=36767 /ORGANISM="Euplotes focardii, Strain TN1" /LENGTH=138 /DNA_ID=CAMNT_0053125967 /DNA_START=21 /DNA_END=437 /DNA_ORIENTATION=+
MKLLAVLLVVAGAVAQKVGELPELEGLGKARAVGNLTEGTQWCVWTPIFTNRYYYSLDFSTPTADYGSGYNYNGQQIGPAYVVYDKAHSKFRLTTHAAGHLYTFEWYAGDTYATFTGARANLPATWTQQPMVVDWLAC